MFNHPHQWLRNHLIYPLMALFFVSLMMSLLDIDERVADYLYALQGHAWAWKDSWLAEHFFHRGGRAFSLAMLVVVLIALIAAYGCASWAVYRKPLLYLALAVSGGSLLVSAFKSALAVSCPWEFSRYGGHLTYHSVFEQLFLRNGEGCFPAAHASAGYAWVGLYFLGLSFASPSRWAGLIVALTCGLMFGFAQQIRGAHFMSHDLWTLAVCWFYSLSLYLYMFKRRVVRAPMELSCS